MDINKNLGISMFGGSSGVISAIPLFMFNQSEDKSTNLYIKNTPTGQRRAETNWNMNTLSNDIVGYRTANSFAYSISDFSSNKHDLYYDTNRGQTSVNYTLHADWSVNSIDGNKDILVVGTKDWTSIEKYTIELEDKILEAYLSPINYHVPDLPAFTTYPLYEIKITWISGGTCPTDGGTLSVSYEYGEDIQSVDINIPNSIGEIGYETIYTTDESSVIWAFDPVNPSDEWPQAGMGCLEFETISVSSVNIYEPVVIPPSWIPRAGKYIDPAELDPKFTHFLLPVPVERFKDQFFDWMNYERPNSFEVPDYSDIFFDIVYDYNTGPDPNYIYGIVSEGNQRKVYSFGGFIRITDFINGLLDKAVTSDKSDINDDTDYKWYIVVKNNGQYYSVGLSHYVTWEYEYKNEYPYPESALLSVDGYEMVDYRLISAQKIKLVKIATFPKCGKVDVFFPAKGNISSFTSGTNIVYSNNHGLSTGDKIKIAGGRQSQSTINGIRTVEKIDENRLALYYDKDRTNIANIYNTYSGGIVWNGVDESSWKYSYSISSPNGKNGYELTSQLNIFNYSDLPVTGNIIDGAVESSPLGKPQSNLQGLISWNNYYPYERFDGNEDVSFEVVNGNKFGTSVKIVPHSSGYFMGISEPGGNESFPIVSDYEYINEEYKPKNRKLVPYFLPYGRIHLYNIVNNDISYVKSYNHSSNPWGGYELANRQMKLFGESLYENLSISSDDILSYQFSTNFYWSGAKLLQWGQTYYNDVSLGFSMPNQTSYLNYYGYLDNFGKDFSITLSDNMEILSLSNVKNADFNTAQYMSSYRAYITNIVIDYNNFIGTYSDVDISSVGQSYNLEDHKKEYNKLSKSLAWQEKKYICWGNDIRSQGTVFIVGSTIQSIHTSCNNIVVSDDLLGVQNGDMIDIYKWSTEYSYVSSTYVGEFTYMDCYGPFILTKGNDEYRGYSLDKDNVLVNIFVKPNNIGNNALKIIQGTDISFFDTSTEYDIGDIHSPLGVISAGNDGLFNYLAGMTIQKPEFLSLVIKTAQLSNEDISLTISDIMGVENSSIQTYLHTIDIKTDTVPLNIKVIDPTNNYMNMSIYNNSHNDNLKLFVGSDNYGTFPLYVNTYSPISEFADDELNLFMVNSHPNIVSYPPPYSGAEPIIPPNYGLFPLFMSAPPSDSSSGAIPLALRSPADQSSQSVALYYHSPSGLNDGQLYAFLSCYGNAIPASGGHTLYMHRPNESILPLIVYNTTSTGNIPLVMSGGIITQSNIGLSMSGYHKPNMYNTLYMRGGML